MKVIGYIRVSTEEQAQSGVSLAAQEAKFQAYAALYDLTLVRIVVEAGVSAKSLSRPGLSSALAALESGAADGLLIAKLDRLTRSVADWNTLIDRYFTRRAALLSVADQIDTRTAAGRLVLNVLMSVAQWEREAIGERTSAALQHLKSQGVKLGAPSNVDPAAVARARELRQQQGLSYRAICQVLTDESSRPRRAARGSRPR